MLLLEEFRDALAALPPYAPVEVRDQSGARAAVAAVDYDDGMIRICVDDVLLVSDDDDHDDDHDQAEDEADDDSPGNTTIVEKSTGAHPC